MTTTSPSTTPAPPAYRGAAEAAPDGVRGGVYSADLGEDEVVLFLIGMRVNRLRRVRSWTYVARQMPTMLRDLAAMPDSPLLGFRSWWSGRDVLVTQVWRSAEELGRFSSDPDHPHAAAWRTFNRRVAGSGDVGIWHETYVVRADQVESIYGNMPPIGLGAALGLAPAGTRRATTAVRRVHGAAGDRALGGLA